MYTSPISEKSTIDNFEYSKKIEKFISDWKYGIDNFKTYENTQQSFDSLVCGIKNNLIETLWLQSRSEFNNAQNYYFWVQNNQLQIYENIKNLKSIHTLKGIIYKTKVYETNGIMTNIVNPNDQLSYEILKNQDKIIATLIKTNNQTIISYLDSFKTK